MKTSLLPPPADILFRPFSDGGVLLCKGSRRIWALNSASAAIWCLSYEVNSLEGLASRLAELFSIDYPSAIRDVMSAFSWFEQEGLLSAQPHAEPLEEDDIWNIGPWSHALPDAGHWAVKRFFQIANHVVEFCCMDLALGGIFSELMAHLAADAEVSANTRLAVMTGKDDPEYWEIFINGQKYRKGLQQNEVIPHLLTLIFIRSCQALEDRLLFHAAVLEKGARALVVPGESGSGKTTLTAALMARGCRFFSDELAVLNVETLRVSALPLPMSIKAGSVQALSKYFPGLNDRAVHIRADEKSVRYLPPTWRNLPENRDACLPVGFFVFPKFQEGSRDNLILLDKIDMLQRLAATGSSNRDFVATDVEAMIKLVEKTPGYELVYGDLAQAISILESDLLG